MNYYNQRICLPFNSASIAAIAILTIGWSSSWTQQAQANGVAPSIRVTIGTGDAITIPLVADQAKPGVFTFDYQTDGYEAANGTQTGVVAALEETSPDNLAEFSIGGTLNADPFISYGLSVIDLGAPSLFAFSFFTPIVPVGSPNVVTASLGGTLNDVTGDGISITPALASGFVQDAIVGAPDTIFSSLGPLVSFGPGSPGVFHSYGPYSFGPAPGPGPGPWTSLAVNTSFTFSGNGDIAALTGFASINIPEPASSSLLVFAATTLLITRSRRRWK